MAKNEIPIEASVNPITGEMTTMVSFESGGINLPEKVKKRKREIEQRDLSQYSEGDVIETVTVDEPVRDPFI